MIKIFICTLFLVLSANLFSQKKVYADLHGIRKTRLHDGELGEWKYFSDIVNNNTGVTFLNYNPDIIGADGKNDIASVNYPYVGMQSQLDTLYIEYQILSAKAAGIDGFFVEWGYIAHGSNALLTKVLQVAKKHDFEVSVNICDGWLMEKSWYPGTRAEKVTYFIECMQYLIDNVFSSPTAAVINNKPVFYLFHDGFTFEEFKTIREYPYDYPENYPVQSGDQFPYVLMRTTLKPKMVNGEYTPGSPTANAGSNWMNTNRVIPVSWVPERIRPASTLYPEFNYYATANDCQLYLKAFADGPWRMGLPVASGMVTPGMNNYGCGGWGPNGSFYLIPREEGNTYSQMWQYNLDNKSSLDIVYIASWNDYTEGHEIEPTLENGFRELKTTLSYSSQFKGESEWNEEGVELPARLFDVRKEIVFLDKFNFNLTAIKLKANQVANSISLKEYGNATNLLVECEQTIQSLKSHVTDTFISLNSEDIIVRGQDGENGEYILSGSKTGLTIQDDAIRESLKQNPYKGYLLFEYWDAKKGDNMNIAATTTLKNPSSLFKIVGQIKEEGDQVWKQAKVEIIDENVVLVNNATQTDISFYGPSSGTSKIRNIRMEFNIYSSDGSVNINSPKEQSSIRITLNGTTLSIVGLSKAALPPSKMSVFSLSGSSLMSKRLSGYEESVELNHLAKGVYLIVVENGTARKVEKIIL